MGGNIFISYRRANDSGFAGRLYDRLSTTFPKENLFLDVDNIEPGLNFVKVLNEHIAECDAVLVLIGRDWVNGRDEEGRRIDNPSDFVRIEIESALTLDKFVVPVLVQGATMPRAADLPKPLQPLASIQGLPLSHERFHADVVRLIGVLEKALAARRGAKPAVTEAIGKPDEEPNTPASGVAPGEIAGPEGGGGVLADTVAGKDASSGIDGRGDQKAVAKERGRPATAAAAKPKPRRPGRFGLVPALASAILLLLAGAYWFLPPLTGETPAPKADVVEPSAKPASLAGGSDTAAKEPIKAAEQVDPKDAATQPPDNELKALLGKDLVNQLSGDAKPADWKASESKTVFRQWHTVGEPGSFDEGTTTWSLVDAPASDGLPSEPAVRADVTVAGKIAATLTLQRNTDVTLPASHMIELQIQDATGRPLNTTKIQGIDMKSRQEQVGSILKGTGVQVTQGFFLFALSEAAGDVESNLKLLREQEWFDVFLTLADGARVTLTTNKGEQGQKVFAEALGAWDKLAEK